MDPKKQARLEALGYQVTDNPDDFFDPPDVVRWVRDLRRALSRRIAWLREERGWTRAHLAAVLGIETGKVEMYEDEDGRGAFFYELFVALSELGECAEFKFSLRKPKAP